MKINIVGVMSGTSLDGIDIAFCSFEKKNNHWQYTINHAETFSYNEEWLKRLQNASHDDALTFNLLHIEYGQLIGTLIKNIAKQHHLHPKYVASHGHTIFHQPEKQLTIQIGSGAAIAAASGVTTICDFRSLDVALGGQGAPLVPIGDALLFNDFDACLNIGGISNISYQHLDNRIAYDISPANMILNYLAHEKGYTFDQDGALAKSGKLTLDLFNTLNKLPFYYQESPKSLGREWIYTSILPILDSFSIPVEDKLNTFVEHIAFQIGKIISVQKFKNVLVTGGGAKNKFLMERLQHYAIPTPLIIPDEKTIDYKEALIFAFLGLLRINFINNCLQSVTGASKDNCGGCIYFCH
jgi:anhydro-N-acetylmuramic acid kinase